MVKLAQRYVKATQSGNLMNDRYHVDTDYLAAIALSRKLGSLLFRVKYGNDATSFNALLLAWEKIVIDKATVLDWPAHISRRKVAALSLAHWLNNICVECGGKGYLPLENVPQVISDKMCPVCLASGTKPLACDGQHQKPVAEMCAALHEMTIRAGARAMKKLAGDMKL